MSKTSKYDCVRPARKSPPRKNSLWLLLGGIALIAIALLALVWFALTPPRGSGATPQLQVSTERLDFGKQVFEKSVHASFQIKNMGKGMLTLNVPRVATLLEGC
jgi:hypothetical protein